MSEKAYWTVGRRKTSIARVKLKAGSGKVIVNGKEIAAYLNGGQSKANVALLPAVSTGLNDKIDILCNVKGGGVTGQIGAIRHAIARALIQFDPTTRPSLKKSGFLTRDNRMVERKKYGRHKARRGTQFSKR